MPTGNVNHKAAAALVLVDVINHFEFPGGDCLLEQARPIAARIAALKQRARRASLPVIYVNDNFGQWRSDAARLLQYCLREEAPGHDFVEAIRPDEEDYFVLKPMHSAFYQTPLDVLLRHLGATTLILCGLASNSCIVCTAHDADMRDLGLYVPHDCCAAQTEREHLQAMEHIRTMAGAKVVSSSALKLDKLHAGAERNG